MKSKSKVCHDFDMYHKYYMEAFITIIIFDYFITMWTLLKCEHGLSRMILSL